MNLSDLKVLRSELQAKVEAERQKEELAQQRAHEIWQRDRRQPEAELLVQRIYSQGGVGSIAEPGQLHLPVRLRQPELAELRAHD